MQRILVLLAALVATVHCFRGEVPPPENGQYPGRLRPGRNVAAHIDMGGVTGTVQFYQPRPGAPTTIHVNLEGLDQYQDTYGWHIHEYPVRFGTLRTFGCSLPEIGDHYDPLGAVEAAGDNYTEVCASDASLCEVGDLAGRNGRLRNDQPWQKFVDPELDLYGPYSPIGHSILIHRGDSTGQRWICANVEYNGVRVDTLRAPIDNGPFQGDAILRRVEGVQDGTIELDIYRTDGMIDMQTTHHWSLNLGRPTDEFGCSSISDYIYGEQINPDHTDFPGFEGCGPGPNMQLLCPIGDMFNKCGPLVIEGDRGRVFCTDTGLGSVPLSYLKPLSIVIRETEDRNSPIISCAPLDNFYAECSIARFQNKRLFGDVLFYQSTPFDRTFIRSFITGFRQENPRLVIRENAVAPNGSCNGLGNILRRDGPISFARPITPGTTLTGDSVLLGNLDPKIPIAPDAQGVQAMSATSFLPLFGPYNITGHSLSVEVGGMSIACATIERYKPIPDNLVASILAFQEES